MDSVATWKAGLTNMRSILLTAAFGFAVGVVTLLMIDFVFATPDVLVSHSTGQCVRVINYPSAVWGTTTASCGDLPTRYNWVWVE
jgi:hypothetical protein